MIPTPHIEAKSKDLIAKTVLMPGDPLRAKYIAEKYLDNVVTFNTVRGMLGFTGTYQGRRISVMGSGMGMPSIGIYSYELFKFYDVENIIRIGSCGAYSPDLKLYDVIIVKDAYSESSFAYAQGKETRDILSANGELNEKLINIAKKIGYPGSFGTHPFFRCLLSRRRRHSRKNLSGKRLPGRGNGIFCLIPQRECA
jgi:purine-nucleoside phosphorylase